jgi:hypothetical protein
MNIYHFSFHGNNKYDVPSHLQATWCSHYMQWHLKRLWLQQPQHCHITIGRWCYNCHILPFVDVKVQESIDVNGNEEEKMEAIGYLWSFYAWFYIDCIKCTHCMDCVMVFGLLGFFLNPRSMDINTCEKFPPIVPSMLKKNQVFFL